MTFSYLPIRLTSAICSSVAIATTLLRLYVRRRAFWFDDIAALLSMLFLSAQLGVLMTPLDVFSIFTRSYLVMATFYATIWLARIAILFTIIRVGRDKHRRLGLLLVAATFVTLLAISIGQQFWVCEYQRRRGAKMCHPGGQIAYTQLGSAIFADSMLLLSSIQLFTAIQEKALRYRLICIFSTCIITTIVSIVHVAFIIMSDGTNMVIAALVEDSVSLVVSSVPVVANIFFQIKERNSIYISSVPLTLKFATSVAALGSTHNFFESPHVEISITKFTSTSLSSLPVPSASCPKPTINDYATTTKSGDSDEVHSPA